MKPILCCVIMMVLGTSCSKIELNDDPIIGIWATNVKAVIGTEKVSIDSEEWIFNDVNLGRYHAFKNSNILVLTDFKWTVKHGVYSVSYPGTDLPDVFLRLTENEDGTYLIKDKGDVFAKRQN